MESVVRRANAPRLRHYPAVAARCAESGAIYAACVTRDLNVEHKSCDREFVAFKQCIQKAAAEMKVRL